MRYRKFLGETFPAGTCHHVLQKFLQSKEHACSRFTLDRLYYNLFPIGQKAHNPPFKSLTRDWLLDYIDHCRLRYAPETVRTIIGDVRGFFAWAKEKRHHPHNIAATIKPMSKRERRRRVRAKSAQEDDIRQVMEYLAGHLKADGLVYRDLFGVLQVGDTGWLADDQKVVRDLFILTFLYETGARVGELCRLGSRAMNEAIEDTAVAHQITLFGKTGDRDYLFTSRTAELWRIWQMVRPSPLAEYAVIGWGKGHHAAPLLPNGVSQMLLRRCREAGVTKPFRTHALRHAKVKRSRKLVGLDMASRLIDHSDVATTRGYGQADEEEMSEAAVATGLQFDIF